MPDFASRRLASTSCVLLPTDETMPIPVTTTRLMIASWLSGRAPAAGCAAIWAAASTAARLHHGILAEQPDLQVLSVIDQGPVRRKPAVGDAQDELGAHH